MDHRARFEARRGMNVRAGSDQWLGMDAGARLDDAFWKEVPRDGAGGSVGDANRLPQHAHELEIQARADQIDGGGDSHASE